MKHVVAKPFTWCPDGTGITSENLQPGDERDFGAIAADLLAEGYLCEAAQKAKAAAAKEK